MCPVLGIARFRHGRCVDHIRPAGGPQLTADKSVGRLSRSIEMVEITSRAPGGSKCETHLRRARRLHPSLGLRCDTFALSLGKILAVLPEIRSFKGHFLAKELNSFSEEASAANRNASSPTHGEVAKVGAVMIESFFRLGNDMTEDQILFGESPIESVVLI